MYEVSLIRNNIIECFFFDKLLFLLNKKKIFIKLGIDPTGNKLHLGHFVLLKKLRDFQNLNYVVYLVIGDFTAKIGDPTGRILSRKIINDLFIYSNLKSITSQIFKILNFNKLNIVFNSFWYKYMSLDMFFFLLSNFSLSHILERIDFKNRYINGYIIYLNELLYPVLQSFDSLFLKSNIEIGGMDQKFNILLGRFIQKKLNYYPQNCLLFPILIGLDGELKMSKTLNNCIFLNDEPYIIFCKIISMINYLVYDYFNFLGFYNKFEILNLFVNINDILYLKVKIFCRIVCFFYSMIDIIFCKYLIFNVNNNIIIFIINIIGKIIDLISILIFLGFINNKICYNRLIDQNSIFVNNQLLLISNLLLFINIKYTIKVGKRNIGVFLVEYKKKYKIT